MPSTIARGGILATLTLVTACGGSGRSTVALIGGVPATTDLQAATGLPRGTVLSVVRGSDDWRVMYRASAGTAAAVATQLCRLEGRAPDSIRDDRIAAGQQLPGVQKITITCRG